MDQRLIDYLATLGVAPDALDGWTIQTAQRAGVDTVFVLTRGPELHILPIAGKHSLSRRNILEHIGAIFKEHGYVTTRVPIAETDHRLRTALGFEQTWEDQAYTYWALTALPYQKGSPCQSQ